MNEAVNDTSLYFRLLVTVKHLSLDLYNTSAKQELFAPDTRLLLMYSVSQKKSPLRDLTFFSFFSQTVENF